MFTHFLNNNHSNNNNIFIILWGNFHTICALHITIANEIYLLPVSLNHYCTLTKTLQKYSSTFFQTLFNPNKTVVKMFVVMYDLSDMPASSQTFIRQRTVYSPTDNNSTAPSFLRYLIHLRYVQPRLCTSIVGNNIPRCKT